MKTEAFILGWGWERRSTLTLFRTYRELQRKCWSIQLAPTTHRQHLKTSGQLDLNIRLFWSATNGKFSNDRPQSQPWQICRCLPPGAWTAWNRWGLWSRLLNRDPMSTFSLSGGWKLLFEHVDSLAISHICRHEWDWLCYECSDKLLAAVCLFARRKWVEFISGFICGFNSLTKTVCVVDVQMCPNADKNCVADYNLR